VSKVKARISQYGFMPVARQGRTDACYNERF
jgi:hypothetical protein